MTNKHCLENDGYLIFQLNCQIISRRIVDLISLVNRVPNVVAMDCSGDPISRRRSRRLAGLHPVVGDGNERGGALVTDETRTMQTRNRRPHDRNTSRHRRRHHRTRIADAATSSRNSVNHENANSRLLATESDGNTSTQSQSERRPRAGAARMQPEPAEVAGTSAEVPRYRRMRLHVPRNPSHRYAAPVHGESYCDCPRQGRDVECKCGEEDNGENCVLELA